MNQLLLFIVLAGILVGVIVYFTNINQENFATTAENVEAVANIASLYNAGNFTATNMNITGTLTVNGVPITGSGTTLNIPNINTAGTMTINGVSVSGSNSTLNIPNINTGTMGANGISGSGLSINGDIKASGNMTSGSVNTGPLTATGALSAATVSSAGQISITQSPAVLYYTYTKGGYLASNGVWRNR